MKTQSSIFVGFLLILAGTTFLLLQFFPGLTNFIDMSTLWPLIPLGLGGIFLVSGLVFNPPLLVPGSILSGIGSLLFVFNSFDLWDFWQLWLLVPVFVGLGVILANLRDGQGLRRGLRQGGPPLVVGFVLFAIFTAVFSDYFAVLWPVLVILAGIVMLFRSVRVKQM